MEGRWVLFDEIPVAVQSVQTCGGGLYPISPAGLEAVHHSLG
jgi:hypothetical protein